METAWKCYDFIGNTILYEPQPGGVADVNMRLQICDTNTIPKKNGDFLGEQA